MTPHATAILYDALCQIGRESQDSDERQRVWKAAREIWTEHAYLRGLDWHPETGADIYNGLVVLWDQEENSFRQGINTTELKWQVALFPVMLVQDALSIVNKHLHDGHKNGIYVGTISIKMLNLFKYMLGWAVQNRNE